MVSSHEHSQIPNEDINGVLVVQNKNMAQTMAVIDLTLEKDGDGWKVADKTLESVNIGEYEADPAIVELLGKHDEQARADAEQIVGQLVDGALAPENEIAEIPTAQVQDTALIDLINHVQMYYTGAPVSAAALFIMDANMFPGDIHKCDMALIYKYTNTLNKLHMTGAKLKKYMEWSVNDHNTFEPGDLTISFNPEIRAYNYDMFEGVNYEVNIANAPGSRIENLTWPDGTPVKEDDEFDIAVNNYRANSQLLAPARSSRRATCLPCWRWMCAARPAACDYIVNVKGGSIAPECNDNWKITGNDWDEALHQKAVDMLAAGELTIPTSEDGRTPNVKAITAEDVQ